MIKCYFCDNISGLFVAPKAPDMQAKWLDALQIDSEILFHKNFRICQDHFKPYTLEGRRCLNTVPIKILPEPIVEEEQQEAETSEESQLVEVFLIVDPAISKQIDQSYNDKESNNEEESGLIRKQLYYKERLVNVKRTKNSLLRQQLRLVHKFTKLRKFLDQLVETGMISKKVSES